MRNVPPVLLMAWRRPLQTARVLQAVSVVRPKHLFVAVDGADEAARPGEARRVEQTIAAIEASINWDCEIQRRYSQVNQGCRQGVTAAIDWFFTQVDEGIVLEDDIVPNPDFFEYCRILLDRFRDDHRVMCISGDNSAHVWSEMAIRSSYTFVHWPQIWGWATWRRAWEHYDRDLDDFAASLDDGRWHELTIGRTERERFREILVGLRETGQPDTWDYQWVSTLLLNGGLSVHPRANLVSNIGFGSLATHTTRDASPRSNVETEPILPLRHPRHIRPNARLSHALFHATQMKSPRGRPVGRALGLLRQSRNALRQMLRAVP